MDTLKPKINLLTLGPKDLEALVKDLGEPSFRAAQLMRWLWHDRVFEIHEMSNLSKGLREKLMACAEVKPLTQIYAQRSDDGTIKYLYALSDGRTVETVRIPREDQGRVTVCISTQVGCRMGCTFCLTAQQKVERNLSAGEIAAQLLNVENPEQITNVVVMGMGEPLDNYEALMQAIELMNNPHAMGIGIKKITVSTSGLVPAIHRFVRATKARLAVSLNASNDEVRSQIMPINRAYNIDKLLGAIKEISAPDYPRLLKRDWYVTFEYILIKNLNDEPEHARELVKRLKGVPCKVNLLLYNENPNVPYQRPSPDRVAAFQAILMKAGILNFVRKSRGRDISAACGQLASESKRKQIHAAEDKAENTTENTPQHSAL